MNRPTLQHVGTLGKPHGFQGWMALFFDHSFIEGTPFPTFLFLERDGLPVPFRVAEIASKGSGFTVLFDGVDSDEAARLLTGSAVFLPQEEAAVCLEGRVLLPPWVGYTVVDKKAGQIGRVSAITDNEGQILVHFDYQGNTALFPAVDAILEHSDDEMKALHVDLPDGLLEMYSA